MSFLNPDKEQTQRMQIHVRSYSWSGGEKPINPANPAEGKKAYSEIRWYEGSGQGLTKGKIKAPMKIAVIGQTFSVSGFDSQGTAATNVSYFSNETTQWGQTLTVYKKDAKGVEVVAKGSYKSVKEKLGKLIHCQHNVYFYDIEQKIICRFTFAGSSYAEWTEYKKLVGKDIYTGMTLIEDGEAKTFATGVAIVPKFTLQPHYSEAQIAEIGEVATKMDDYEVYLNKRVDQIDADEAAIDQTPSYYEGEQSQEFPEAPEPVAQTADMTDVPF